MVCLSVLKNVRFSVPPGDWDTGALGHRDSGKMGHWDIGIMCGVRVRAGAHIYQNCALILNCNLKHSKEFHTSIKYEVTFDN